ncbi:protein FAF-like, chloroplastic [Diospyros lotus]|uniref:protein FAF-like, chloroplastic n=1 Tax=Diospyros lotus TaxID=55363 RepID=UPI002259AC1E|nr:protein FAF-like, chloroplastic [Diospyros lotus]
MSGTVAKATEKQGIVSILGSDCDEQNKAAAAASLRRTLSADMSSKKWLARNGFYPMKKISSSELAAISVAESSSSSSQQEEELDQRPGQDEVWRSIQSQKKELSVIRPNSSLQLDTWSSILSQKEDKDSSSLPPPYIHPLVRRSSSSLSEKSLEICTESLGSETGSDGFSSYASSETGDVEEEREQQPQPPQPQQQLLQSLNDGEELRVVTYNNLYPTSKRNSTSSKSFPPPLPFLPRCDGPSLHMKSHRNNGRLVLEAVSLPSQNYFHAQRKDGRLVLTFSGSSSDDDDQPKHDYLQLERTAWKVDGVEEIEEVFETSQEYEKDNEAEEEDEDEEEEETEEKLGEYNNRRGAKEIGIVMKKLVGIDKNFNKEVNLVEAEEEIGGASPLPPQSLPRPPRMARLIPSPQAPAAAASFNTYEYFWRSKQQTVATLMTSRSNSNKVMVSNNKNKKKAADEEQEEMVLLRGNKGDYLVPLLKGCKEPRRSLLIWELPYCIAT